MKRNNKILLFVIIFLGVFLFFPIFNMLLQIERQDFFKLFLTTSFQTALKNSLFVTMISTIISTLIAYLLAAGLNRTNIKYKSLLVILITIPMLIPSISHGVGLLALFGTNGILTKYIPINIVGETGIIIGSILYSFPVAFLLFYDGFRYIDNNMYATCKVLNLNKWQTFQKVTLPYMKKPIFSAIFAVFTLIFTDYGVPLAVGGKFITLPVYLYKEVIGLLNFSTGTIIGLILLIPAFISFVFDTFSKDFANGNFESKALQIEKNKWRDYLYKTFVFIILTFILIIMGSFIFYAFIDNVRLNPSFSLKHIEYVMSDNIIKYIQNSLFISIFVSILGTIISYLAAYATARLNNRFSRIVHILSISSLAVPGIVLGIAYTISFNNTFFYNTIFILILVNIIHFMATPYLMAYNALGKVNKNYELVAKTCHISSFRLIKDVIIPSSRKTIREMIVYFFVNSMITISAITFLFNARTMPLSLLINTYEGNMLLGEAALISLLILLINIIIKIVVYIINEKEEKKYENYNKSI